MISLFRGQGAFAGCPSTKGSMHAPLPSCPASAYDGYDTVLSFVSCLLYRTTCQGQLPVNLSHLFNVQSSICLDRVRNDASDDVVAFFFSLAPTHPHVVIL